jgi:hypothetical protein
MTFLFNGGFMNIPYDTGKVKIGINYRPKPYIETDKDMLFLQECMLQKKQVYSWFRNFLKLFIE